MSRLENLAPNTNDSTHRITSSRLPAITMPAFDLNDLLDVIRQPDRLAPQDAHDDRSHKRRHKHRSGETERRHHSSDRGYRSDDGHRRRDGDEREKHGHRARSSHRSRSRGHGTDEEEDLKKKKRRDSRRQGFDDYLSDVDDVSSHPKGDPSPALIYGDHLLPVDSEHVDGRRARRDKSRTAMDNDPHNYVSIEQAYGDHRLDDEIYDNRGKPLTRPYAYGDHHLDESTPVHQPQNTVPRQSDHDLSHHHAGNDGNYDNLIVPPLPTNNPGTRDDFSLFDRQSTPDLSSAKIPNYAKVTPSLQQPPPPGILHAPHQESRPSPSGSPYASSEPFPNVQLPRLSVSQYPSDLSHSDAINPSDSRSEAGAYDGRSRSGSAPSATSTALLSPTSSVSSSGVLGPKTYQYQPLKETEFRLVKILPERMSKLKCKILHRSLNEANDYIAISVGILDDFALRHTHANISPTA